MNREPGWYRDPYFRNRERYWDGEAWSEQTRDPAGGTGPALPAGATTSAPSTESTGSAAPPANPPGRPRTPRHRPALGLRLSKERDPFPSE